MAGLIALEEPPPPPKRIRHRAPDTEPVWIHCLSRLTIRWSDHLTGPRGEPGRLTHVWASRAAWRRRSDREDPAWRLKDLGFVMLAYRVDW